MYIARKKYCFGICESLEEPCMPLMKNVNRFQFTIIIDKYILILTLKGESTFLHQYMVFQYFLDSTNILN